MQINKLPHSQPLTGIQLHEHTPSHSKTHTNTISTIPTTDSFQCIPPWHCQQMFIQLYTPLSLKLTLTP